MSAPEPVVAAAAVPSHEEIGALSGAVREDDLSPAQCELLALLLDQIGTSARVSARLTDRHRGSVWDPVVEAYVALVAGGVAVSAPVGLLRGLSPHQVRLATLIADGLSNPEIRERLGIASLDTVRSQLKELFRRLGVRNRAQVAAVVAEAQVREAITAVAARLRATALDTDQHALLDQLVAAGRRP